MNDLRIARNDDEPYTPDFWDDCDRAYVALTDYHYDGEVVSAVSEYLCSSRDAADLAALAKKIEALGDLAKEDYIAERSGAPE